jgi:hypothetical protein
MQRCTKPANTRRKIVLAITSHAIIHTFNTFSLAFTLLTLYFYHRSEEGENTMTFFIKNTKTDRIIKDAITCKKMEFPTREHAEHFRDSMVKNFNCDDRNQGRYARLEVVQSA